jgi:hypothetical protein
MVNAYLTAFFDGTIKATSWDAMALPEYEGATVEELG